MHGRAVNLHSQTRPRLHRAIPLWGGMAQLFRRKRPYGACTMTRSSSARKRAEGEWGSVHARFQATRLNATPQLMNRLTGLVVAAISAACLLVSCATLPADGDAVECDACQAMWIYLSSGTPAPGLYRLNGNGDKRATCARCQKIAVGYFESGGLLQHCPDCGGRLRARGVDIIR